MPSAKPKVSIHTHKVADRGRLVMALRFDYTPRLMPAPQAAHYLGMSESKLRTLEIPRRMDGGKRVYHINDLIAYADSLPIEGEYEANTCDATFGVKS